jgi:hypothetical protein
VAAFVLYMLKFHGVGFVDNTWNDIFMRLVMSNTVTYLRPELTVVVGDIFSSQRILDGEFNLRVNRFNWIFSDVTNANVRASTFLERSSD